MACEVRQADTFLLPWTAKIERIVPIQNGPRAIYFRQPEILAKIEGGDVRASRHP